MDYDTVAVVNKKVCYQQQQKYPCWYKSAFQNTNWFKNEKAICLQIEVAMYNSAVS